jgi:hypothetical protein
LPKTDVHENVWVCLIFGTTDNKPTFIINQLQKTDLGRGHWREHIVYFSFEELRQMVSADYQLKQKILLLPIPHE